MVGIYKITSPTGRIYVGQSKNITKRKSSYKRLQCKKQPRLYNSIICYGWDNHIFEAVEQCSVEKLNERERYWQDHYDVLSEKGLNCVLTEISTAQKEIKLESKIKMSLAKKGSNNPNYAKYKDKNPFFGKKHSQETIKHFSEMRKGKKIGKEHHNSRKVLNVLTGELYFSRREAAESINISPAYLTQMLQGKRPNKTNFKYL